MIVTRFAPSPTGYLHLGHAFAAVKAAEAGEKFLLRIEDLDRTRCRPEYEEAIIADLRWLGLSWPAPVMRQSTRGDAYSEALARLSARELLYPCFCTRKEIAEEIARISDAPHGPEGPVYPGTCRQLSRDERDARMKGGASYALRLDAARAVAMTGELLFHERGRGPTGESGLQRVDGLRFGDIVLARKDAPAAYHLAAVVDDAAQGVTLVTRADDLFAASHVQRLLQALLGFEAPAYAHHPVLRDKDGRKLSKRDGVKSLRDYREEGASPADIRRLFTSR